MLVGDAAQPFQKMLKKRNTTMVALVALLQSVCAQYEGWQHAGSLYMVTGKGGVALPPAAAEEGFPLLVRLDKDWFDFSQAQASVGDLRFSMAGTGIPYQIDEWEPGQGRAAVWVRLPSIKGDAQQELKLYWGRAEATSESDGKAVFNESNGYLAVFHLEDPSRDAVESLKAVDQGTAATAGVIGQGRRFAAGRGMVAGEQITTFPMGAAPHATELWFRAERSGDRMVCWGSGGPKKMVQMILDKPPRLVMDGYGSWASLRGTTAVALQEWNQVVHTCQRGESRMYLNGVLEAVSTAEDNPLEMTSPVKMYLGGWENYGFRGDMDEVRVSKVARSADWVRLQYENQKPQQRLVGPLVQAGDAFSTSVQALELAEGERAVITVKAGGARKLYWILQQGGAERVVATDRFSYALDAGRVAGDQRWTLQCQAVFATEVKTINIPVAIKEALANPVFALRAPTKWDGREGIEVLAEVSPSKDKLGEGASALRYRWKVEGPAVSWESTSDRLFLRRAQGSGTLRVWCLASNGGEEQIQMTEIAVEEPAREGWEVRVPDKDEKPVNDQFYGRGDDGAGTLYYGGSLEESADEVFLKLYADGQLSTIARQVPGADGSYALSVKLRAGLISYRVELGTRRGAEERVVEARENLVCGDAYIIEGQSNAVGYNYENTAARRDLTHAESPWIRSFGGNGEVDGDPLKGGWGRARVERIHPDDPDRIHFVSVWGMALAKKLVEEVKLPICLINGAVGGTRIDEHLPQRLRPANRDRAIYENLRKRIVAAKLSHGIRGLLWHQGEADQGFDGPDNGYGCETYQQYWLDLTAAWKQDYPNLRHYYLFQIYPNACSQGGNRNSDKLREVQRQLAKLYSSLSVMSTLQFASGAGCHFGTNDYEKMGWAMAPLLERDACGTKFATSITAPDLRRAFFTTGAKDEIALEFDQAMIWDDSFARNFKLDGEALALRGGVAEGAVIKLKLPGASAAKTITYVSDKAWDAHFLLCGENGIAALTFCEVDLK